MRNIDWSVEDTHWEFVTSWRDGNYPRKPRPGEVLLSDDDGNHAIYRLDGRGALEAWKLWAATVHDSDTQGEAVIMGTYPNFYVERKSNEGTYEDMTVEHLGRDASDEDLAEFRDACERVLHRFNGDKLAATDYVWNNGNILWEAQ